MKKSNNVMIDWKKFLIADAGFLICLNLMFLIYGLISGEGYAFDLDAHVLPFIPTAFLCGLMASIKRIEREEQH